MAEILKEWLTERLQRKIVWDAEEFGNMMKDGHIIAGVLLSYNVINEEKHFLIRSSNAKDEIQNNWKYLKEWLRELEINLTDADVMNVMEGKGTSLLRLFYQLFLHLDKMDRVDFIKRERKMVSSLVQKLGNRFKVDKVDEKGEPVVDYLSKPLLDEKQFIEWQRKKSEEVKDTFDYLRHKFVRTLRKIEEKNTPCYYQTLKKPAEKLSAKDKKDMEIFSRKFPCSTKNYTYEQLLDMETKAAEDRKALIDSEWAQNYMDNLYTRMHKKTDSEEFQKQMRNALSSSMWNMTINEEESKHDTELAKKVLKLSQVEKQMCTQIMETKQQARNIFLNRAQAEKEYAEQRKQQFEQYLDNIKEHIHSELTEIDYEKARQNKLHKILYAEKIKRKRKHYYEICYETMLSIVDYATRYAYFKKLIGDDIPEHYIHEWKMLYFKKQPIFEIFTPTEDLLKEHGIEEELLPEVEEIIRLELDRQEAMNDSEFIEYHNYTGPWNLDQLIPNYDPESEDRKIEYLGTRVLGHVVYTLLEMKYPYPPLRPPADLPQFTSKALLRNLPDRALTTALQTLLNFRDIHVVRLEAVINYCLRQFKVEMIGCTDIELSFDKFLNAAVEEPEKDLIRLMKTDDDIVNKSQEPLPVTGALPPNVKQTQTPKTIPEEDIVLSTAADLGKYAYEALSGGDVLTDYLLAAMLVEYLKAQGEIKGFVIVNYPNSFREAQILEVAFSGRAPPGEEDLVNKDDIYLEEAIINHLKVDKDKYKEVRKSEVVNNPHKKNIDKPFESYFTCYAHLKETEDILQEPIIWDLTDDNSELIDRFYSILGINYSMYYEVIEKEFLAQICKYIIGDVDCIMSVSSCSNQLFGENVLHTLDFPSAIDKRTKSKIIKPETSQGSRSKDRLGVKSKSGQLKQKTSNSNVTLNVVKDPSSEELSHGDSLIACEKVAEENMAQTEISEKINILAGEEDWDYGLIPIVETIGIALATSWEQVEKTYLHDMKQLFFAIRLQMNCLALYVRFIKDKMEQIITLPSTKQDLVCTFQKEYNEFENDWRTLGVSKNEWHCRVKDLQNKLYQICDERKLRAEQRRQALIMDNWTMEELTTMVNSCISCMQTELNRSMLTFQALHDFYYAQIKRMPPNDKLSSKDLTKINRESDDTGGKNKSGEDKVFRQLKAAFLDLQLKNIAIDYGNNPFNLILENNAKFALKVIKDTSDSYRTLISKEYNDIAKVTASNKKKDDSTSVTSVTSEEVFKANALKCIEEWIMGSNGEMYRASLRILAIQYKCYQDMKLFSDMISKTFMLVQNEIDTYYMNEIKSVDRLCKYLQLAIENGWKIADSLILENDTFVIDPNLLQFPPTAPPAEHAVGDHHVTDLEFKVAQLAQLSSQFKIVAPTGIALQQAFIYLVQDFVVFGQETCDGSLVPELWRRLDPEQIPKFVFIVFGDTAYVDWRDFLIFCTNLRFPTVEELLDLRHDFRCIDQNSTELIGREDFTEAELWFERDFNIEDPCAQLRKNLLKQFLFDLFETSKDVMNYSAFLLAFCKNPDPIEGFASALSIAVGKKICYSGKECNEVVCNLIKLKKYRDDCLACALECTNNLLDNVIAKVIDICEGTTITEVQFVAEEKKGKKGKGAASKAKKSEQASQSARITREKSSTDPSKNKAQSAVEVRSTYICPPCAEDEIVEDKAQEKEMVEEVHKAETPKEDPDLAYAVSQKVIWNVLQICLPWHFSLIPEEKVTPYVEQVEEILKRLEVDTDDKDIYICRFLKEPHVCKLLHKVKKFTAVNMTEELRKIMM